MGTWIEVPLRRVEFLGYVPNDRVTAAPHVTMLHFGKVEVEPAARDLALGDLHEIANTYKTFKAKVSGCGEFLVGPNRVPVLLINSATLCNLRNDLKKALRGALSVGLNDAYGFQPHVTLTKGFPHRLERVFSVTVDRVDIVESKGGIEQGRWNVSLSKGD